MRTFIISLSLIFFNFFCDAQIVTNLNGIPSTSTCGKYQWNVKSIEIYSNHTLVEIEITALKPIRRLNIYDNYGHLIYGNKERGEGLGLNGEYSNGKINYLGNYSTWGWNNVGAKEKRTYILHFGGGTSSGNIPPGATNISIYGIGVEADGMKNTWQSTNITINNPRKYYTGFSNEYSIKQYLDSNNDGICGIYEVINDNAGSKFACIKHNGEYALIFMSDNLNRNWWKVGDIKAYLHQSTSGIFKTDWLMSDKSLNKDVYLSFDGVSMIAYFSSSSNDNGKEQKYLKMYPTSLPSYNNDQQEYTPQRKQQSSQQKQIPQTKKTPILRKQNIKN